MTWRQELKDGLVSYFLKGLSTKLFEGLEPSLCCSQPLRGQQVLSFDSVQQITFWCDHKAIYVSQTCLEKVGMSRLGGESDLRVHV